ncbi:MAG: hypothetical protein E7323_05855 [Clostridiales bacterium]|nr:hypothetical protein [Clostridiales bacterium]
MTETTQQKMNRWSAVLCNASVLLYVVWLLLPALQTTGRAITGVVAVWLFALGVLLDCGTWKKDWLGLAARALSMVAMPLVLFFFAGRGGDNLPSFVAQNGMFFFPLVFCGYARQRGDSRLWRWLKPVLLAAVTATVLTTIFWLIEGMFFRGDTVYAYSRSLGNAEPGYEAYLKELMLKNIGGYDFVYAMVAALPLTILGIQNCRGWKRGLYAVLLALETLMIVLSQYTYAMLYAAVILAVEILAALLRWLSRGRVKMGLSLVCGLVPLLLVWFLRMPLLRLAQDLFTQAGLESFAFSLEQLMIALEGGVTDENSRLVHYQQAVQGIRQSPLLGSLLGGEKLLSRHSDVLDILSGMGILGGLAVCGMLWLMGRGGFRGMRSHPAKAQLCVVWLSVLLTATLGTVCYSRDVMAVAALGTLLVLEGAQPDCSESASAADGIPATEDLPDETE